MVYVTAKHTYQKVRKSAKHSHNPKQDNVEKDTHRDKIDILNSHVDYYLFASYAKEKKVENREESNGMTTKSKIANKKSRNQPARSPVIKWRSIKPHFLNNSMI
jgi:hypothetical protein